MKLKPGWTAERFWIDRWLEYLIGTWNSPEAHSGLWRKCGATDPRVYSQQITANRRLMLAAPKLYKELQKIVQDEDARVGRTSDMPGAPYQNIRRLLAECRGEAGEPDPNPVSKHIEPPDVK